MKPFVTNDYPTIGVEEEFHLIDPETAALCHRTDDVMAAVDASERDRLCHELFQSVLESRTGVCRTADELVREVCSGRRLVDGACRKLGIGFAAAGSHPFSSWKDQVFVDSEHYRWVRDHCRYVAHRLLSFGLHIHVGVKNEGAAVYVMNEMRRWAYPLVALSANSPFYDGVDTGLASIRTHLFNAMPRTRFAPGFKSFAELVNCYETLLRSGDITRPGDLWWCIRPQPPLGTVEFRLFDLPTSVRRIGALAAIVQAAVVHIQNDYFDQKPATEFHDGFLEQNWWRAQKDGLNARVIEPETGEVLSVREQLFRLLDMIAPTSEQLGAARHIQFARDMLDQGSETDQQQALFQQAGGDLRALELEISRRTMDF